MLNLKSDLYSVNKWGVIKSFIYMVGVPLITILQQLLPSWTPFLTERFGETGGVIIQAGIAAFLTALTKTFLTDNVKKAQETLITAAQNSDAPKRDKIDVIEMVSSLKEPPPPDNKKDAIADIKEGKGE